MLRREDTLKIKLVIMRILESWQAASSKSAN
jgi:hypothetical protein